MYKYTQYGFAVLGPILMATLIALLLGWTPWFVSSLNILFHEAGHLVFGLFGEFIHFLGGTLGELIIPSLFIGYFYRRRDSAGLMFGLWWLAVSCMNISWYVADTSIQKLHLVGGGTHDWLYMLGRLRLLNYDQLIARGFTFCAVIILALMVYLYVNKIQTSK